MKANYLYRRGFTLIELMVVIIILAILAALVTRAVSSAMTSAKRALIKLEVDQLSGALEHYKTKYGSYPPVTTDLLKAHIRDKFPRALPGDVETIPTNLTPAEILWFCIRGYTSDPQRPVDFFNSTAKRDGEYQFDQGRLLRTRDFYHVPSTMTPLQPAAQRESPQRVFAYVPQTAKSPNERMPYIYFDCSRDYPVQYQQYRIGTSAARPYRNTSGAFANAGKFQIISAGLDDDYGTDVTDPRDVTTHKIFPDGINYSDADGDNLVNFSERDLENSKP